MMTHASLASRLAGFLMLGAIVVVGQDSRAESWRRPVQGGLIGGAFGALISRSSDIDSRVAIPALAATGAMIGYGRDRGWWSRDDRYYIDYGWPYYPHAYTWGAYPHAYGYGTRSRVYRRMTPAPVRVREERIRGDRAEQRPELQPGVSVGTVAVQLPNGFTIDVRVVKLHDRYIGPRGEVYTEKPSAEILLSRMQGGH